MLSLALLATLAPIQDEPTHLGVYRRTISGLDRPGAVAFLDDGRIAVPCATQVRIYDLEGVFLGGPSGDHLLAPTGAVQLGDALWVADELSGLSAIDAEGGSTPRSGLPLASTGGIAAAGERLAVADPEAGTVVVLDGTDPVVWALERQLSRPVDVAFDGEELLVLDADRHAVLRLGPGGEPRGSLGAFGFPPGLFAGPSGLALHDGELFVADTENHRIQVFDAELVRDGVPPLKQAPRYWLGQHAISPREGAGKLHYPTDVAVSPNGEWLAVLEPLDDRVQLFQRAPGARPALDPLRTSSGQASPHYGPYLAIDGRCMVIVEPETQRLLVHDLRQLDPARRNDPLEISFVGGFGDRLGLFRRPAGLDLDLGAGGVLLACDPGTRRVQEFTLDFDPERELAQDFRMARAVRQVDLARVGRSWGEVELDHLPRPVAVARARSGEVFVLDAANERVLVLGSDFAPRRAIGPELRGGRDLALTADGQRLFVAEQYGSRVRILTTGDGTTVGVLGLGLLADPAGIVLAGDGRAWVTDSRHCAVFAFDAAGNPAGRFGTRGIGPDQLYRPRGIARTGDGELVVIDHGNHRGVVLTEDLEFVHAFGSRLYTRPALDPDRYPPEQVDPPGEGDR